MLVLIGVAALVELGVINGATEQIATKNLVSVQAASDMRDLVGVMRRAEARIVMNSNEKEKAGQENICCCSWWGLHGGISIQVLWLLGICVNG